MPPKPRRCSESRGLQQRGSTAGCWNSPSPRQGGSDWSSSVGDDGSWLTLLSVWPLTGSPVIRDERLRRLSGVCKRGGRETGENLKEREEWCRLRSGGSFLPSLRLGRDSRRRSPRPNRSDWAQSCRRPAPPGVGPPFLASVRCAPLRGSRLLTTARRAAVRRPAAGPPSRCRQPYK